MCMYVLNIFISLGLFVSVNLSVCVSLDTGCVGRVGMPSKIFNPPPQFSRLDIQCPALVYVLPGVGVLGFLSCPLS